MFIGAPICFWLLHFSCIWHYHILNNHFKIHAACLLLHPVIDALIHIKGKYDPDPESIERIEIEVAPLCNSVTNREKVTNLYEAKFSIQFCSAVALTKGAVGNRELSETLHTGNHIKVLMQKVEIRVNPSQEESEADVFVYTNNDNKYHNHVSTPKGGPTNPVAFDDVFEKFKGLNEGLLSDHNIEEIGMTIKEIENLSNISDLVELCIF